MSILHLTMQAKNGNSNSEILFTGFSLVLVNLENLTFLNFLLQVWNRLGFGKTKQTPKTNENPLNFVIISITNIFRNSNWSRLTDVLQRCSTLDLSSWKMDSFTFRNTWEKTWESMWNFHVKWCLPRMCLCQLVRQLD